MMSQWCLSDWFLDGGEEQQDAAAHRLQDEMHPAGRPDLHRHVQSLRQTHEPDPVWLRRVQENQVGSGLSRVLPLMTISWHRYVSMLLCQAPLQSFPHPYIADMLHRHNPSCTLHSWHNLPHSPHRTKHWTCGCRALSVAAPSKTHHTVWTSWTSTH